MDSKDRKLPYEKPMITSFEQWNVFAVKGASCVSGPDDPGNPDPCDPSTDDDPGSPGEP